MSYDNLINLLYFYHVRNELIEKLAKDIIDMMYEVE